MPTSSEHPTHHPQPAAAKPPPGSESPAAGDSGGDAPTRGPEVPVARLLPEGLLPSDIKVTNLPVGEVIASESSWVSSYFEAVGETQPSPLNQQAAPESAAQVIEPAASGQAQEIVPTASAVTATLLMEANPPSTESAPTVPDLAVTERCCPACGAPLHNESQFCHDCGYALPGDEAPVASVVVVAEAEPLPIGTLVGNRYEIRQELSRRPPTIRYLAADRQDDGRPVVLVQQALSRNASDQPAVAVGRFYVPSEISTSWPELGWEVAVLERVSHPCWPRVLDVVQEDHACFVVEEAAVGPDLWQIFDDPNLSMPQRFELLAQFADGLKALAQAGAIPEYLKPELLRQNSRGQFMLVDLNLLVPLPYPARTQIATTPYTPPELVLAPAEVDARSPLYSFGAMLYALYLGHELTETDFEHPWSPKPLVFRYPDAHPAYARLVMKTFVRGREYRFPTDEAARSDATGWDELARALRHTGQQLNITRLDVAGWNNIGKLRSNNEDAFALWHASNSFEERLGETLFAILCDGMGGYEAGEVAAAMAIDQIRQRFFQSEFAKPLLGQADGCTLDPEACRKFLFEMLREVNHHMYQFSRSPQGKRGMGCTCELLYLHGQQAVIAHVGDSRTYHYCDGQLRQLTRDQTLVNRLVELGQLTPEEAENHPRKNELQQALGAQPFVEPQTLAVTLKPGDWLLLCTDGLTNHVDHATLTEVLQRADSAEMCARRLVNLANAYGGSDNTTVIAIRCQ